MFGLINDGHAALKHTQLWNTHSSETRVFGHVSPPETFFWLEIFVLRNEYGKMRGGEKGWGHRAPEEQFKLFCFPGKLDKDGQKHKDTARRARGLEAGLLVTWELVLSEEEEEDEGRALEEAGVL